jgi:hypothetical protein
MTLAKDAVLPVLNLGEDGGSVFVAKGGFEVAGVEGRGAGGVGGGRDGSQGEDVLC